MSFTYVSLLFLLLFFMNNARKSPLKKTSNSPKNKFNSTLRLSPHNRSKTNLSPRPGSIRPDLQKRSKSRQKLAEDLDTYTLLIRSKNPIRCLQHNSNISIYCQTEQKLLCANCIYGRTQHKFHRVTPVDRSLDKIGKDVQTMNRLIDRQLQTMNRTVQKIYESLVKQENDARECLSQLVQMYEDCHRYLEQTFSSGKSLIIQKIQFLRKRYENLMFEIRMQTQNYNVASMARNINKDYFNDSQLLLYQHSICSAIVAQKRFQERDWLLGNNQVVNIGNQQKRKIFNILQLIRKLFHVND